MPFDPTPSPITYAPGVMAVNTTTPEGRAVMRAWLDRAADKACKPVEHKKYASLAEALAEIDAIPREALFGRRA